MTYSNRTTDGPRRPPTRSRVATPPGNESGGESNRGALNRSDLNPGEPPVANEPPVLLQIPNLDRGVPAPTTRRSFLPPALAPATLAAPAGQANITVVHHRSPSELTEAAAPPTTRPTTVPQAATWPPLPPREANAPNYRRFDPPEAVAEAPRPAEPSPPDIAEPAARATQSSTGAPSVLPAAAPSLQSTSTAASTSSFESTPAETTTPPATLGSTAPSALTTEPSAPTTASSSPTANSSSTTDTRPAEKVREGRRFESESDEPRSGQPRREPAPRESASQPSRRSSSASADVNSRADSPRPDTANATSAAATSDSSSSSANAVKPADVPVWERIVAYRPGLPALLVLVLAVIGLAYVYRPQETPGRKRGVRESSDWRRTADGQRDSTAPPISTARRPSLPAAGSAKPSTDLPLLEFNAATPPEETRDAAPVAKDRDVDAPADSLDESDAPATTPPDEAGDGDTSQSGPRRSAPARLASRAKHAEYRDTTDPPELEPEPQVGREDEYNALGDDGPPPDITGQTYPRTDPANYLFRPEPPAEREANRALPPQGELR